MCGHACSGTGQTCKVSKCCTQQSSRNLISGAGFDSNAAFSNWLAAGGASWTGSDDAEVGCSSGSVSFTDSGTMSYCYHSATAGATYYLGMKAKGSTQCIGAYYGDTNCTDNQLGPDFLNVLSTGSSDWKDTGTSSVAPAGTKGIYIQCFNGPGAIDQIYLNQGSATGFGG